MLDVAIEFVCSNSLLIINLSALQIVFCLTHSAKNKDIGVLVLCYYAFYILLDLSEFGLLEDNTLLTFTKFSEFYLMCMALTMLVFIASLTLFIGGNNPAGLYALWLLICLTLDGVSSIFQLAETNALLIVYNVIQNISVYVDLFVVFIGMDHIIKRKHNASRIFIECINNTLECWRVMVLLLCNKGAKCSKKKSIN